MKYSLEWSQICLGKLTDGDRRYICLSTEVQEHICCQKKKRKRAKIGPLGVQQLVTKAPVINQGPRLTSKMAKNDLK